MCISNVKVSCKFSASGFAVIIIAVVIVTIAVGKKALEKQKKTSRLSSFFSYVNYCVCVILTGRLSQLFHVFYIHIVKSFIFFSKKINFLL